MDLVDVVVVGAGPTGLTLAGDLARAGRSVVVLDKRPEVSTASRAFATMARTLEVLDARGLADDLLALGSQTPGVHLFAGARLSLDRLPTRFPFAVITPQVNVDRLLAEYASTHGATIRRGVEVVDLRPDADGVDVVARDGSVVRARYVVGADGAHSVVRSLVGIPFPGKVVLSSVALADVELAAGPTGPGLSMAETRDGLAFLAPYGRVDDDGSWFRAMTWDRARQLPDTAPVDVDEVRTVLTRSFGHDLGLVEMGWKSRFHCEERIVPTYRRGRVLLAGDAAHVHSPVGGQGMNTGIQDAANLAWKLAAVLGGAPESALDSYDAERRPVGRRVVRQSGAMMRAVTLHPRVARWVRDRVAPRLLSVRAFSDAVAGSFAGTGLRYPRRRSDHRLVGTRADAVTLVDTRLALLLRDGGWVLVVEPGGVVPALPAGVRSAVRSGPGPALLVRPDGYVAWAGPSASSPASSPASSSASAWREVLGRWTGASADAAPHEARVSPRRATELPPSVGAVG